MARPKNMGLLTYDNVCFGDDYIRIKYDSTKCNQDGDKVSEKQFFLMLLKK